MTGLNGIETEQQFMEEDVLRLYLTLCAAGNVQDAPIIFNEENGYCEVPGEYVKQIISERITNADSHINKGVWKTTYNEFNNLVYDEERDVFCYYPGGEYFAWLEDVIMSMNISQQPDDLVHVEVVWNNFYRQNLYFPMNEYKKLMRVTTSAPADFGE